MAYLSIDCACGTTITMDDAKGIDTTHATALIDAVCQHHATHTRAHNDDDNTTQTPWRQTMATRP